MSSPDDIREALAQQIAGVLIAEGAGPGHSIHSWRCGYPDIYGPCDCVNKTAQEVAGAVLPWVEAQVAPLRDEVEDYHEQVRRLFAQRDEARAERDAAAPEGRRSKKHPKPCPRGCECLCHDTDGGVHDHYGQPCPGKNSAPESGEGR